MSRALHTHTIKYIVKSTRRKVPTWVHFRGGVSQRHVPGFETAIDKTAMAEAAAVKAQEAAERALRLLKSAEAYNQEAAELRSKQKSAQEELAVVDEKVGGCLYIAACALYQRNSSWQYVYLHVMFLRDSRCSYSGVEGTIF
jgi:hypothetical protein